MTSRMPSGTTTNMENSLRSMAPPREGDPGPYSKLGSGDWRGATTARAMTRSADRCCQAAATQSVGWARQRASANKSSLSSVSFVAVEPLAHFLAGLEERNALLVDRDMRAG